MTTVQLKRVYEPSASEDGFRVLVERLWPRGMTKERVKVDLWLKEAGASTGLRKWYGHDPQKWEEFRARYFKELTAHPAIVQQIMQLIQDKGTMTLLYSARDEHHNNAVALKEFLEENIHRGPAER